MSAYPVMLNLEAKSCVVIGGGTVAARKVTGLIDAQALVTVISPTLISALQTFADNQAIEWVRAAYQPGIIASYAPVLVFAATDDPRVNQQIVAEAQQMQTFINAADAPTQSDFSNMAAIHRPPIVIGLHTGSTSPALARHLKDKIAATIGPEYELLAGWLGDLRPQLRQQIPAQSMRQQFYETVLTSDILPILRQGDVNTARQRLDALVRAWI